MADITPVNVIHGLPPMTFRGLASPPYDGAGFTFRHTQPSHGYPNLNGASHDWQGLEADALSFKLYFLNTIGQGQLFPDLWVKWWPELKDGRPGKMVHPLLGKIDVVVKEGSVQLAAAVTSGVIVDVQFESTLVDPEATAQESTVKVSVKKLAALADEKRVEAEIEMPDGVLETDLLTLVAQLDGFLFAMENQALGIVNRAKGVCEELTDFIDKRDPRQTVMAAREAIVSLWTALDDLGGSLAEKIRPVVRITTSGDVTLDSFARTRGMSLAEAIELNPLALMSPTVPQGTVLLAYAP